LTRTNNEKTHMPVLSPVDVNKAAPAAATAPPAAASKPPPSTISTTATAKTDDDDVVGSSAIALEQDHSISKSQEKVSSTTTTNASEDATADAAAAAADANAGRRLLELVVCANVGNALQHSGWRACGVLSCVSKTIAKTLRDHDDAVWRAACLSLAAERALYAPEGPIGGSWRKTFHQHLHPARDKWAEAVDVQAPLPPAPAADPVTGELLSPPMPAAPPAGSKPQHFNIAVVARFRPGRADDARLVLPLHQRLRMIKKGEKLLGAEAEREGVDRAAVLRALVEEQGGAALDPEVMAAVLEAEQLRTVARQAAAEAAGCRFGEWNDDEDEGGGGGGGGDGAADDAAGALGAAPVGARQAEARAASEAKQKADEDANSVSSSFAGGGGASAKVLAVMATRAVMFVPGAGVRPFHFAHVFAPEATQDAVYADAARGSVLAALNGYNACLMCYGQTGSGKTHTLTGPPGALDALDPDAVRAGYLPPPAGVVPRALAQVLASAPPGGVSLRVTAQYVQIYREKVTCLISGNDVILRGGGGGGGSGDEQHQQQEQTLVGAAETTLNDAGEALAFLRAGEARRAVASTAMNDRSSRAHTVLVLQLEQRRRGAFLIRSRLNLVDLAGSEQLKMSKAAGERAAEAIGINASLSVLGKCIAALTEGRRHVPYLESKLTTLLRPALGGNSRTTVVVTGSMEDAHAPQTLAALRFGETCAVGAYHNRPRVLSLISAVLKPLYWYYH
jgi:hypothetical protein